MTTEVLHPTVSVIIPAYNRADHLPRAVGSVLDQTFEDFELIVLDDGSTDNTVELLRQWEVEHPDRFRWTSHPNKGQIPTVNEGFEMARGEYFYVLNSDDYLYPECLEKLASALRSHPEAVLAYGDWTIVDINDETIAKAENWQLTAVEILRDAIVSVAGVLYTRRLVETVGGWDTDHPTMPDYVIWLAATLLGDFVHVPHQVAVWRSHPDTITLSSSGRTNASHMIALYDEYFANPDLPDEIRAIENEAWRNLFIVCGLSMSDVFVGHDGRFSVFDRTSWRQSVMNERMPIEEQMLAWRNHARRLEELEAERRQEVEALRAELEEARRVLATSTRAPLWKRVLRRARNTIRRLR